jgi:hypothetical protein
LQFQYLIADFVLEPLNSLQKGNTFPVLHPQKLDKAEKAYQEQTL